MEGQALGVQSIKIICGILENLLQAEFPEIHNCLLLNGVCVTAVWIVSLVCHGPSETATQQPSTAVNNPLQPSASFYTFPQHFATLDDRPSKVPYIFPQSYTTLYSPRQLL